VDSDVTSVVDGLVQFADEVNPVIGLVHHLPVLRCVERRRTGVVDGVGRTVWQRGRWWSVREFCRSYTLPPQFTVAAPVTGGASLPSP
jgi:hypothetical protein